MSSHDMDEMKPPYRVMKTECCSWMASVGLAEYIDNLLLCDLCGC